MPLEQMEGPEPLPPTCSDSQRLGSALESYLPSWKWPAPSLPVPALNIILLFLFEF